MKQYKNCYINWIKNSDYLIPEHSFISGYLKFSLHSLLDKLPKINCENLTIEITDIPEEIDLELQDFKKILDLYKKPRIVLTYQIRSLDDLETSKPRYSLINTCKELGLENIAIDFYFDSFSKEDGEKAPKKIEDFLNIHQHIKHFSIYFNDDEYEGFYVDNLILDFKRYQHNMWSKDNWHAMFNFLVIFDKNCLGIGPEAISRLDNEYFIFQNQEKDWSLKKLDHLDTDFVVFNDHIDRLSFYYKMTDAEINTRYKRLSVEQYHSIIEKNDNNTYLAHEEMIGNLFKDEKR